MAGEGLGWAGGEGGEKEWEETGEGGGEAEGVGAWAEEWRHGEGAERGERGGSWRMAGGLRGREGGGGARTDRMRWRDNGCQQAGSHISSCLHVLSFSTYNLNCVCLALQLWLKSHRVGQGSIATMKSVFGRLHSHGSEHAHANCHISFC